MKAALYDLFRRIRGPRLADCPPLLAQPVGRFRRVRANAIFRDVEDTPITTPEQAETWSYVLLWLLGIFATVCITGACIAFANV